MWSGPCSGFLWFSYLFLFWIKLYLCHILVLCENVLLTAIVTVRLLVFQSGSSCQWDGNIGIFNLHFLPLDIFLETFHLFRLHAGCWFAASFIFDLQESFLSASKQAYIFYKVGEIKSSVWVPAPVRGASEVSLCRVNITRLIITFTVASRWTGSTSTQQYFKLSPYFLTALYSPCNDLFNQPFIYFIYLYESIN